MELYSYLRRLETTLRSRQDLEARVGWTERSEVQRFLSNHPCPITPGHQGWTSLRSVQPTRASPMWPKIIWFSTS